MNIENEFHAREVRDHGAGIGIILGSGLGPFVDRIHPARTIDYSEIPGLPNSAVPGHAGRFALGEISGCRILVAQGRVHLYEGHSVRDATAHVRFMAAAGIRTLVLTNAAGSANPSFKPGDWMQITDHINLTGQSPLTGGPHFVDMSEVYCRRLVMHFARGAAALDIPLHEGVYAAVPGPQYETPAEVRMLRTMGADAIGMSTVPEAVMARALGLRVAGFSCLTNWAAGLGQASLDHGEVIETGKAAADRLIELFVHVLPNLD